VAFERVTVDGEGQSESHLTESTAKPEELPRCPSSEGRSIPGGDCDERLNRIG
jgi:hypothetical protein